MSIETFMKLFAAEVCGIAGFLWGQLDGLLLALIAFMILDYLTGVIVGIARKNLNSETGFTGLLKKFLMLVLVAVGHILDTQILGGGASVCRSAVIGFYLANEGISILENTAKLGVKWPDKLKDVLEQLNDENDKR